jgi:predicted Co/Zn/Cd cation transporter (cation efflux family)
MAAPDPSTERQPLLRSIALTGAIGVLAVIWGIASGSQMILLDGAYALIGLVVSWLLLAASRLAGSEPGGRYPFGRESVTPLVIGVQGFVLLATLVFAAVESVATIREGGSTVTAGWAILYSTISTIASVVFWLWLRSVSGDSDLLVAEATAWRIGALRGTGMMIGFITMAFLANSSWSDAAAYVDPVMVLITCGLFLAAPIRMVRTTILELLEGEPEEEIRVAVHGAVESVAQRYGVIDPDVRMTKVGPKLYVELEALVAPDVTVAQQHQVREELHDLLDELPFDLWLNVEFMPRDAVGPTQEA